MKKFNLIRDEKGAVMPLFALILFVVLLGFSALVVDAGILYSERRTMVTAADAAALAGSIIMRDALGDGLISEDDAKDKAEGIAKDIAVANGIENPDDIQVIWDNQDYSRKTITIIVHNNKDLIFGRFLGFDDTKVGAKSVATWGYVTKLLGGDILPIFTKDDDFKTTDITYLHDGKFVGSDEDVINGNWGLIDVFDSTREIGDAFRGDKIGIKLELNYMIDNQSGKNVGNVDNKIVERMIRANELSEKEDRQKYMSGLVPVIDWKNITKQGSQLKLPIKHFAVFEIYDVIVDGGNNNNQPSKGSIHALYDNPDYRSDNVAKVYDKVDGLDLEKSTIIGKFTGETVDIIAVMQPDDQVDPNPGGLSPKYHKLIE